MAFPRALDTKGMSEFVVRRFVWDQRGKAFPPLPLPKDFQTLCPDFNMVVAEQAVEDYGLPEITHAIFYVMLLIEAKRLGVLYGPRLQSLEVALSEVRWGPFMSWVWLFGDRIYEARFNPSGSNAHAQLSH